MNEQSDNVVIPRKLVENLLVVIVGASLDWIAQVKPDSGGTEMPLDVKEHALLVALESVQVLKEALGISGLGIQEIISRQLLDPEAVTLSRIDGKSLQDIFGT